MSEKIIIPKNFYYLINNHNFKNIIKNILNMVQFIQNINVLNVERFIICFLETKSHIGFMQFMFFLTMKHHIIGLSIEMKL